MAVPIETFLGPNFSNLMITLVVPFLLIFTVLLFALKKSNIFGKHNLVYVILASGFTILIYGVRPEVFQFLASYLFQIGVAGTVITLGGLIIILFWMLVSRGVKLTSDISKSDQQKLNDLTKEKEKLLKKYYSHGIFSPSIGKRMEIMKQIHDIDRQIEYLKAKKRT